MKNKIFLISTLAIVLLGITTLRAGDEENSRIALLGPAQTLLSGPMGLPTKISLDLRNIDVIDALKFLSMKAGLNIIPTQKVTGRVTLRVENVPVKDVFDIMLRSNSLAYDIKGEIYNVMTEAEYKALYGKNFSDTRQVRVLRLKYAIPEHAFSLLDALKSEIGRLLVEPDSGTVMIMDTPEKIEEAQNALDNLEQKGLIKVFDLKYAKAKDMEEQLKNQLDIKKVGTIKSDERNNQIIVQTLPERMKDIEQLVRSLDKKTRQVLIETKIIKIRLSNDLDQGVQWEGLVGFLQSSGLTYLGSTPFSAVGAASAAWRSRSQVFSDVGHIVGSYPFSGTTSNFSSSTKVSPGQKLHVGIINAENDFDVLFKYLQTIGKTKILSNPTVAVINNQEAKMHVGERRAYVTTTTTTGTTTSTISEAITYVDVGIQLFIVPTINDEGYITMKIKPEISSIVGNVTSSSNNLIPIIDTSSAETTVIVKDGATIMLAGLGQDEKTETSEGIPILSKIPILGFLFRSKTQSTVKTELLVLLTPYIFEGDSLITPRDRDKELFGIKKAKKFDVFRKELSVEKTPEISSIIEKQLAMSKGLKTYDGTIRTDAFAQEAENPVFVEEKAIPEENAAGQESSVDSGTVISAPEDKETAAEEKEEVATKGFKQDDDKNQVYGGIAVKELANEDRASAPKDFKAYNNF
jgi:type II secretory pathway component GspD/PulD (secretin)